jgi:hypothetical protein
MDKKSAACALLLFLSFGRAFALEGGKKLVVFYTPAPKGISADVLEALSKHPKLKLAVVWPSFLIPSEKNRSLALSSRLEAVPTADNEPIFPLIYETNISTPVNVGFSWRDDVSQMIYLAQQGYLKNWNTPSQGIFLESGVISPGIADEFKKMNITWAAAGVSPTAGAGVFGFEGFTLFMPRVYDFSGAEDFWQWASSSTHQRFAAVWINKPQLLTAGFINALAQKLEASGSVETVLPSETAARESANLPQLKSSDLDYDFQPWLKNPAVWQRLQQARQDIEEYKNSGLAKIETLETAKDEIFGLYDYELLAKINENPGGEQEQRFLAGLSNVYRLIKKNMPPEMAEPLQKQFSKTEIQSFQTVASQDGMVFYNSTNPSQPLTIGRFDISFSTRSVIFEIILSTQPPGSWPGILDIYVDMNNKPGAGLAQLLQGINAFMKPQDAWEFAFRMEGEWLYTYRSGRFVPSLVKKEKLLKKYRIEVPASVMRGNPLKWGYQVVLCSISDAKTGALAIDDFLCPEKVRREKLLERVTVELPAQRMTR